MHTSHTELVRAVVAAPVIVLLPQALTERFHRWRTRLLLGLVLTTAALAPYLGSERAWVVVLEVTALTTFGKPPRTTARSGAAAATLAAVIAALLIDGTTTRRTIAQVADARALVIVLAGLLIATVLAGAMIGHVLHPFAQKLERDDASGIERAGRAIGWLERTLLFGLIVAGAPDAAAIVVAAKSVARFPSFSKEAFGEYYLIGTLLSFLSALAVGLGVRAALGLPPLP